MNWRHLQAFLWLRWRLSANRWRRDGALNFVLMMIVAVGALSMAIPLFAGCFAAGVYALSKAEPVHLLYVWDGVVLGFALMWCVGLMVEVQRTEILSMSKFLHLPVSAQGVFLINYVSSLMCLTLIVFVPAMLGLGLGLAVAKGLMLFWTLPLLAAFLLMVTALTYQFQGWLASLMSNPRRRRAVVVGATVVFMVIFQLPNLLNIVRPWGPQRQADQAAALVEKMSKLEQAFQAREFDAQEHARRQQEAIQQHQRETEQAQREIAAEWERMARLLNLALPIGWLPLGVMAAAEGRAAPAVLGTLAMTLIGAASLWRAYRTTVGMYQGRFTARKGRPAPIARAQVSPRKSRVGLLEAHLPMLSEPASAIALAGVRSLLRSPETKMVALTPLLMGAIFGAIGLRQGGDIPVALRPLTAIGMMVFVLFCWIQLMINQFGFDRDGFRIFVLCAAPRREILLGKNLSYAPLALAMTAVLAAFLQALCPLRLDHLLAMLPQFVSMFLLLSILANLLSIYVPVPLAVGSMKPASVKLVPVLVQMAATMIAFPLVLTPTLLPLGAEALSDGLGWTSGLPICLVLSVALCAAVVWIYRKCLRWQGGLLQAREQRILECVTNRAS